MTAPLRAGRAAAPSATPHPRRPVNSHNRRVNTPAPDSVSELPLRDTKYRELARYPEFGVVTAWLRDYVRSSVPNARMSEREYWSVSCLPDASVSPKGHRLVTIYAGDLEVAGLRLDTPGPGLRNVQGWITVTRTDLEEACGAPLDQVGAASPALRITESGATATIEWTETPESRAQFDALPWRAPARALVTELVRTGRSRWADLHSPQIAQFAFED